MPASETSTVVIACPHCGTRYQVPFATVGAKGRNVQCAHCQKSWLAKAVAPERIVDEAAERTLDAKFTEEERRQRAKSGHDPADLLGDDHRRTLEEIKAAIAPRAASAIEPLDPAAHKRRQQAFSKRQRSLASKLPVARLRRGARFAAAIAILALLGGGLLLRVATVQQFPQLAGLYAAAGLGVNVVGLQFEDVRTLKSLQQGAEVLVVDAGIRSVSSQQVAVPQVIVTLLGPDGDALYEWSVQPPAAELRPNELVAFETQLTAPPGGATSVQLTFANARSHSKAPGPMDMPRRVVPLTEAKAPMPDGKT